MMRCPKRSLTASLALCVSCLVLSNIWRPLLMEYAGRYARPFMDVVVTVNADRLLVQEIRRAIASNSSAVPTGRLDGFASADASPPA